MHHEDGFLAAIRQTPADDSARLVYADWLDEQDDPTCQSKAAFIRLEFQMAEAPELGPDRARLIRALEFLAAQLAPDWLVAVSHPKLEACRFRFECPQQWARLEPTDDPKVRLCGTCKKNVHYCDTFQEAQAHAANGTCVALTVALARRACLLRTPQPAPPKYIARRVVPPSNVPIIRPADPLPVQLTRSVLPPTDQINRPISLTPDMIERVGRLSSAGAPDLTESVSAERSERSAGERPKWKQERKKRRGRRVRRENREEE